MQIFLSNHSSGKQLCTWCILLPHAVVASCRLPARHDSSSHPGRRQRTAHTRPGCMHQGKAPLHAIRSYQKCPKVLRSP
ncbi:hypothetical protein DUNSADRAFT_14840 [Dunaliella salina]|uniref:Secreted protein n=1 Tax=Dunaliella salina TaxID=3046 RepID=A0ABQ7H2A7_DUNSA|nr:hypothetical protein DUNSADRAFT_14840 [Dunaliella salina]|eukprot:KAF5840984.1 hypothetical protein DUNSADRAFT_14840 [Dunaliella salina]